MFILELTDSKGVVEDAEGLETMIGERVGERGDLGFVDSGLGGAWGIGGTDEVAAPK